MKRGAVKNDTRGKKDSEASARAALGRALLAELEGSPGAVRPATKQLDRPVDRDKRERPAPTAKPKPADRGNQRDAAPAHKRAAVSGNVARNAKRIQPVPGD